MDLFLHPSLLAWALGAALACALLEAWAQARRRRLLLVFAEAGILGRLFAQEALGVRRVKNLLEASALVLLLLALAGPQWGVELVETRSSGSQAVIAVDTSLSMLAEDIKPNRMERAKAALSTLIDGLKGGRTGLVAFAGEAHVQCPLTSDSEATKSLLRRIQVGMIPQPGTDLTKAIRLGSAMLRRHPGRKALVLLTDGEDLAGNPQEAAVEAAQLGIHLYLIGTGTPEGEPIPLRDSSGALTGYKKDQAGQTVITRLDEASLASLAAAGGGAFFRATPSENEVAEILRRIEGLEKGESSTGSATRFRNHYRLPLALAFLLLLVELLLMETSARPAGPETAPAGRSLKEGQPGTGEGKREALLLLLLLALPFSFGACSLRSDARLWKGNKEYRSGDFGKALEQYGLAGARAGENPKPLFNAGDALYKLGEFGKAEEAFSRLTDTKRLPRRTAAASYYNLGNTFFRQERPKEAVEAYRRCLLLEPADEDCRHNLALALRPPQGQKDKKDQDKQGQPPPTPPKQKSSSQDKKEQKQSGGMSQEDAERILQAVKEKERTAPPVSVRPEGDKPGGKTGKDW